MTSLAMQACVDDASSLEAAARGGDEREPARIRVPGLELRPATVSSEGVVAAPAMRVATADSGSEAAVEWVDAGTPGTDAGLFVDAGRPTVCGEPWNLAAGDGGCVVSAVVYGGPRDDRFMAVARAPNGDLIAAGSYGGSYIWKLTANFGGSDLDDLGYAFTDWGPDLVIARYEPDGGHVWSRNFGGLDSAMHPEAVAVLDGGVIVVAGIYGGDPAAPNTLPHACCGSAFVTAVADDGAALWSLGTGSNAPGSFLSLAESESGFFVGGYQAGSAWTLGAWAPSLWQNYPEAYDERPVLARLDRSGAVLWGQLVGGEAVGRVTSVIPDGSGGAFVAGCLMGPVTLGSWGATLSALTPFIARFTDAGTVAWSHVFDGAFGDVSVLAPKLALGPAGLYVATSFRGSVTTQSGTVAARGYSDYLLQRWTPDGAEVWSRVLGSTGYDYRVNAAATTEWGVLLAAESNTDAPDMGGGTLAITPGGNALLVAYNEDGSHRWSHAYAPDPTVEEDVTVFGIATLDSEYVLVGTLEGPAQADALRISSAYGGLDALMVRVRR